MLDKNIARRRQKHSPTQSLKSMVTEFANSVAVFKKDGASW